MRIPPFFLDLYITNYAYDNTPHSTNINLNKVLYNLEKIPNTLFKWFTDNLLKVYPEKSFLLTNSVHKIKIDSGGMVTSSSKFDQTKSLLIAFITSQFPCSAAVWVFHNRKLNNHKNRISESLKNCISRP